MTNTAKHRDNSNLHRTLHRLARDMRRAATQLLARLPSESEAKRHADELDGAAGKVDQWIEEVKETR